MKTEPKKRGRKPLPPGQKPSEGHPKIQFRLEPALHAQAMSQGGNDWARGVIERELRSLMLP